MGQFIFKTAGESHGKGLIAVIEGMVAGLEISEDYIARDLQRRQQGYLRNVKASYNITLYISIIQREYKRGELDE